MTDTVAIVAVTDDDEVTAQSPSTVAHTHVAADITDSTAFGRILLGTDDATDARDQLNLGYTSLFDTGAVGDGSTDDTDAFLEAESSTPFFVPAGTFITTIAASNMQGRWYGDGTIKDTSNNKRGRMFSAISAAPSSFGTYDSISTYFNGDNSKVSLLLEHRVTGADTLGDGSTAYNYDPETTAINVCFYNSSGKNTSTSTNSNRTGGSVIHVHGTHAGEGDFGAINVNLYSSGAVGGSVTDVLAAKAIVAMNGTLTAGADGHYINTLEFEMVDGGFDVSMVGAVFRLDREDNAGALNAFCNGVRIQSTGATAIDSAYMASGPVFTVLDTVHATVTAAITSKADQRWYFNCTADASTGVKSVPVLTNYWMEYDSGTSLFRVVVNNNSNFSISDSQVNISSANGISVSGTGCYRVAGSSQATTGTSTADMTNPTNKPGATTGAGAAKWLKVIDNSDSSVWWIPMWAA